METQLKITRPLFERVHEDLSCPHQFAWERVGYLLCNSRDAKQTKLIAFDYVPVPDEFYVEDDTCGARFTSDAVRLGMSLALEHKCSVLHVHVHALGAYPSKTDKEELPGVAQSIVNASSSNTHGWLILSKTTAYGELTLPCGTKSILKDLSVVGHPMVIHSLAVDSKLQVEVEENMNNSRQGFLGLNFNQIAAKATIGIVGLGGGGSHTVQQLAHIGFQNYVLCDNDRIAESNLNRLVGASLRDVENKEFKSAIASRIIKGLQPNAFVDSTPGRWEDKREALAECDIVFGCLDNFVGRRDLEAFCRRQVIPLIDIGMDVRSMAIGYEIYGQIALSLPEHPCLHCLGVISEKNLEHEAADYGDAGFRPQVVWPNGILASSAVGMAVSLISNWSGGTEPLFRLDYTGSTGLLHPPPTLQYLKGVKCPHYKLEQTGSVKFISI
ncbi:MAG: ThiF family adenylyltransferase [Kiritimatiellae bacterium]|jgi:molybdopterin/thiamine biosynthesis adenylyltransferase|nr:ThiF family adenylyltransferase [Kiritimatiellia bacterium]